MQTASNTVSFMTGLMNNSEGVVAEHTKAGITSLNELGLDLSPTNLIDSANESYNFVVMVMQNKRVYSPTEALKIQEETENFVNSTILISKAVSVGIKGLDTLTRLQ